MTLPLIALSESSIHFVNVVSFKSSGFYRKRGCVTMCNYAGMCKCICSYNLVFNVLIQLLPLRSSVFVMQFSNIFWHRNEALLRIKLFVSLQSFICHTANIDVRKCFYFCHYQNQIHAALVLFVQHSCHTCVKTCVACVTLVLSCCTHLTLVLHLCCLCHICVACLQ